jgi:hypothetical protein
MTTNNPASFLKPNPPGPATVDKSGPWGTILKDANLSESDVQVQGGDNSVSVISSDFWGTTFSSSNNSSYFQDEVTPDTLHNTAWMGDETNSGVMLLSTGPTTPIPILGTGSICEKFGIPIGVPNDKSMPPILKDFLNKVLSKSGLNVVISPINTSPHNPNAVWCLTTSQQYQTVTQLSFSLAADLDDDSPMAQAIKWINSQLGLAISLDAIRKAISDIPPLLLTLRKTSVYSFPDLKATANYTLSLSFTVVGFECSIEFQAGQMAVFLQPTESSSDIFNSISHALGSPPGLAQDDMLSLADQAFASIFDHLNLWYIKLQWKLSPNRLSYHLSWGVAALAIWTITDSQRGNVKTPLIISLIYDSQMSSFRGQLVLQGSLPLPKDQRQESFDHRTALPADLLQSLGIKMDQIPNSLDLYDLFPDKGTPPDIIPHFLSAAQVTYQKLLDCSVFGIYIDITSKPGQRTKPLQDEAPSSFDWKSISVMAQLIKFTPTSGGSDVKSEARISVMSNMALNAPSGSSIPDASITVTLGYDNSQGSEWSLSGSVTNLSVALLASYFDINCSDGAMAVLGQINLSELDVFYVYTAGKASSFLISGTLLLGELELDLNYQYISTYHKQGPTAAQEKWGTSPPNSEMTFLPDPNRPNTIWIFEAFLKVGSPMSTIGSVAESIKPGTMAKLPGFVRDISLAPVGDPNLAPVKLQYSGDNDKGSTLVAWVSIGPFNLTFIQIRTAAQNGGTAHLKRLLRISVDQIPFLNDVPLIGQLPQPFDHLVYLWVEDDDPSITDDTEKGLTRGMINGSKGPSINTILSEMSIPPIQMKEVKKENDDLMELVVGHHFEVISNGKVVLDHVFHHTDAEKPEKTLVNDSDHALVVQKTAVQDTAPPEAPATKGTTNTKAGPLTVSALSLQYKNGSLFIGLDATVVLGPLLFAVKGFIIELDLSKVKIDNLASIITAGAISVALSGLEAGLSKPPLTLEGYFAHVTGVNDDKSTYDAYQGGVAVGMEEWSILAVGEYRITTFKNSSQTKSVFV